MSCRLGAKAKAKYLYRAWRYRWRVERSEVAFVLRNLKPGQTCLDIGAHKGAFTYWMQKRVGAAGRVFSFEPQPELAGYLAAVKAAFGFDNVQVIEAAVSSAPGVCTLVRDTQSPSPGATLESRADHGCEVPVQVESLDHFFQNHRGRPIHFIKCDVEGHELEAFRGAEQILLGDRPVLLFECEQRHKASGAIFDVFAYLNSLGYVGDYFQRGRLHPLDGFRPQRGGLKSADYVYNFVFRPCSRPPLLADRAAA